VEQGRLCSGIGAVVVLLVLAIAIAFAAGPTDAPVFVAPEVDFALAVGEGAPARPGRRALPGDGRRLRQRGTRRRR
jgi:hypothetical protein